MKRLLTYPTGTFAQPAAPGQHNPIKVTFKGFARPSSGEQAVAQQQSGRATADQQPKKKRRKHRDGAGRVASASGNGAGKAPLPKLRFSAPPQHSGWDAQLAQAAADAAVAATQQGSYGHWQGFGGPPGGLDRLPAGRPPKGQKAKKPRLPKAVKGSGPGPAAGGAGASPPAPRKPPQRKRKATARSQQQDEDDDSYPTMIATPDRLRQAAPSFGPPPKVAAGAGAAAATTAQLLGTSSAKPASSADQVGCLCVCVYVCVFVECRCET